MPFSYLPLPRLRLHEDFCAYFITVNRAEMIYFFFHSSMMISAISNAPSIDIDRCHASIVVIKMIYSAQAVFGQSLFPIGRFLETAF